jgi:glycosyltransferase involved in cell wall biosynthesis
MRILHLVKTVDGADWAFKMVGHLKRLGVDIHVCLPKNDGRFIGAWKETGAVLHFEDVSLTLNPVKLIKRIHRFNELVSKINPEIVHSHFVTNTFFMRWCLRHKKSIKKIFQVPGPLHLEHSLFRLMDLLTANSQDFWIASSRHIRELYKMHGIKEERVFLSYYGSDPEGFSQTRWGHLRQKYSITNDQYLIGNVNYFYAPKKYLFQKQGIKNHELLLQLSALLKDKMKMIIIGKQWGKKQNYFTKMKHLFEAHAACIVAGYLPANEIKKYWADFDLAVHVPLSENCGGVIEPLMSGVPVIASNVGGLPEVIIPHKTGLICETGQVDELLEKIDYLKSYPCRANEMARVGGELVRVMFDSKRTAGEIYEIYEHLLIGRPAPDMFDSYKYTETLL